jgi:hypothetical protein
MSEEMARKKKEDIATLEQVEKSVLEEIKEDKCPVCGLPTAKVEFVNMGIVKTFGWIECTRCGNVYTPKSILKQKRLMAASGLAPAIQTPIEPPPNLIIQ